MQVKDFCNQMESQLETFQNSVSKIEKSLDEGGTEAKQRILSVVGDIKNLMTELSLQKERLKKECPSDWSDDKTRMEGLVNQIHSNIDRTWTELSLGDVGG